MPYPAHSFMKIYRKTPKFSNRKLCCNLPKIQEKRPNLRVFPQKDANGIANSVDPDQTAPRSICPKTVDHYSSNEKKNYSLFPSFA